MSDRSAEGEGIGSSGETPREDPLAAEIFQRDLNEVQLLIEFVSGRSDKTLHDLKVTDPADPSKELAGAALVQRITAIRYQPAAGGTERANQAALLLLAKDALSGLAHPARGLTIAYTNMFAGAVPLPIKWLYRGNQEATRTLSAQAFPLVEWHVRRFNRVFTGILVVTFFWLVLTSLSYWDVASGLSIVQRIDQLKKDRAEIVQLNPEARQCGEVAKSEAPPATAPAPAPGSAAPAPAAGTPAPAAPTPSSTKVVACERLDHIGAGIAQARKDLRRFIDCSTSSCFRFGHVLRWAFVLCGIEPGDGLLEVPPAGSSPAPVDQTVGGILTVVSTYVLPMMFGVLGTLIAVVRALQWKVRDSLLGPRDLALTLGAIPIGAVAGVAVGLYFSPSTTTVTSAIGNVSLTASGLGLLAGYGADAFFRFVDVQLIARVFAANQPASPPAPATPAPPRLTAASPPAPPAPPPAPGA